MITVVGLLAPTIIVIHLPQPLLWSLLLWAFLAVLNIAAWRWFHTRRLESLSAPWIIGVLPATVCAMFMTLSGWVLPLLASIATLYVILAFNSYLAQKSGLLVVEPSRRAEPLRMAHASLTSPTVQAHPLREEDIRILIQRERIAGKVYDYECLLPGNVVINWSGSPIRFSPDGRYGIAARAGRGLFICDRQQRLQYEFVSFFLPDASEIILQPDDDGRLTLQQFFAELITSQFAPRVVARQFIPYKRKNYIVARDEDVTEVAQQADSFVGKPIDALLDRLGRHSKYGYFERGNGAYEWHTATKIFCAWTLSGKISELTISDIPAPRTDKAPPRA
ncbi:hypothetical protein FJU30_17520 [Affinibrenneria salicis]|uniref:Uncharacterized protein n=1 Tax=Affinibrenneria salicis TaxID=2590031 RepID=A0A5J5FXG4_9GAMM|nr:hypothetical protein [Affinibrenneria salicis]KAA8998211.1 hypothetical protein FJU30_17520 [Affinibrenneria salicis]